MLDTNVSCRPSCCVMQLSAAGGEASAGGHRDTGWDGCADCCRGGELPGHPHSPSCAGQNSGPSSPVLPEFDASAVCRL